jgi:hypothetical protein
MFVKLIERICVHSPIVLIQQDLQMNSPSAPKTNGSQQF